MYIDIYTCQTPVPSRSPAEGRDATEERDGAMLPPAAVGGRQGSPLLIVVFGILVTPLVLVTMAVGSVFRDPKNFILKILR